MGSRNSSNRMKHKVMIIYGKIVIRHKWNVVTGSNYEELPIDMIKKVYNRYGTIEYWKDEKTRKVLKKMEGYIKENNIEIEPARY